MRSLFLLSAPCMMALLIVLLTTFLDVSTALSASTTTSSATSSSSSSQRLSFNQKSLQDVHFPRTWVPLASTDEVDPDRPTKVDFMGNSYVTYQDNAGQWVVVDDACPHRLAPLSEGRIDRTLGLLECSYHGWAFDSDGKNQRIPQMTDSTAAAANPACHVHSYSVQVYKKLIWAWLWPEDALSVVDKTMAHPEQMVGHVAEGSSTYTRDLPYGWDTFMENILDAAHVPWAHHGLQGTRSDAIPINMTLPTTLDETGFSFSFSDRTQGLYRSTEAQFKAPFCAAYEGKFSHPTKTPTRKEFKLTVLNLPTRPGWSRAFVISNFFPKDDENEGAVTDNKKKKKKKKKPLLAKVFQRIPTWLLHVGSSRFLDSDLYFLHVQEQERQRRRGGSHTASYFMPSQSDRFLPALQKWFATYATLSKEWKTLPPLMQPTDPAVFDRYAQHAEHCRHCQAALTAIGKWKRRTYVALSLSLMLIHKVPARIVAVASLALLRVLAMSKRGIETGGFAHYKNH